MNPTPLREQARLLREKGKTYSEIQESLRTNIPKSTLSYWCRGVVLPKKYAERLKAIQEENLGRGRETSRENKQKKRLLFLNKIDIRNKALLRRFSGDQNARKMALAILYLGEGSKTNRGSLMFGNSDPLVVCMFVELLRECYTVDERKFRCTVQCRADQDVESLERFWSTVTKIPLSQFYGARIDKRTRGQISNKKEYKGVCRIDYFSSEVDLELKRIARKILETFSKGL